MTSNTGSFRGIVEQAKARRRRPFFGLFARTSSPDSAAPGKRRRTLGLGRRKSRKGDQNGRATTTIIDFLWDEESDDEPYHPTWDQHVQPVRDFQKAFSQMRDLSARVDPELIRGVELGEVMVGLGRHFSRRRQHANDQESDSFAVPRVDTFISHAWSASRQVKYIGLFVEFCSVPAAVASVVAAVAVAMLQMSDVWTGEKPVLGAYSCYRSVDALGCPNNCCDVASWSSVVGAGTFVLVGVAWPSVTSLLHWLRLSNYSYFLDKLCIDQSTDEGKQAGIRALGQILAHTNKMHIMWSPGYFQRLWCIFEISAFLQIRATREAQLVREEAEQLRAEPGSARARWRRLFGRRKSQHVELTALPLGQGVVMMMLVLWLVQLLSIAYSAAISKRAEKHGVGGVTRDSVFAIFREDIVELFTQKTHVGTFERVALTAGCGALILTGVSVGGRWLRRCVDCHITIREQLRVFSVEDAKCFMQSDKVLIHHIIGRWYSKGGDVREGLRKFEQMVRTRTLEDVDASIGKRGALPPEYLLLPCLAASWGALDWMASLARTRAGPDKFSRLIFVFAVPVAILPLAMQLSLLLLYALRHRFADTLLYGKHAKLLSDALASALLLASMVLLTWPAFYSAHHQRPVLEAVLVGVYLVARYAVTLSGELLHSLDRNEQESLHKKGRSIDDVKDWISTALL